MKFSKAILAVAAGVALSSAALAQDQAAVSAEKQSGIKTLIPTLYGDVQVRHYTLREMEDDKLEQCDVKHRRSSREQTPNEDRLEDDHVRTRIR